MKESAKKTLKYTEGLSIEDFLNDEKTIDAVVRNFEIIREASNRIDEEFKIENPQIEWRKLKGFRNRIDNDYFGIDHEIIWTIIENDLEELIFQLNKILKK